MDFNKMSLENVQEVCNTFHINVTIKTAVKEKEQNYIKRPNKGLWVKRRVCCIRAKLILYTARQSNIYFIVKLLSESEKRG